jgi:formate hydrogenlyase transcriptional activator
MDNSQSDQGRAATDDEPSALRSEITAAPTDQDADIHRLIDVIPQQLFLNGSDGGLLYVNRAVLDYHGVSLEAFFSENLRDRTCHPDDLPHLVEARERAFSLGSPLEVEVRVRGKDGQYRWFIIRSNPMRNEQGRVIRWFGTRINIDDRRRGEDQVRLAIDTVPGMLWTARPDGWIDFINQRWLDYTGITLEQGLGWGWEVAFHPDDLEQTKSKWRTALVERKAFESESRIRRSDGEYRWFLGRAFPLLGPAQRVLAWYGSNTDIHDRKQAEDALRRSEAFLAEGQRLSHVGSWSFTPSGTYDYWSKELYEISGFDPTDGIPTVAELRSRMHPEDQELLTRTIERRIATGRGDDITYRLVHPQRGIRFVHAMCEPVYKNGTLAGFVGAALDITEHERLTEEARRREAYLAQGQALSHTGSFGWDVASGEFIWSEETFRIFGYDPAAIKPTADAIFQRVHPEDVDLVQRTFNRVLRQHKDFDFEHRLLMPDGRIKHVHVIAQGREGPLGKIEFVGSVMDVTEQCQAQKAIKNAFDEIKKLKDELHRENVALKEEIDQASMFEEIVGSSTSLKQVLVKVVQVAPMVSTVLITGETGTGKELIARAIHKRSRRADRAFVRVNCAAIAPSLIASELFGHERGAFTGAVQRRQGRFELAEGGTLFLDEIGELPEETQLALLRVLQEREFERVGGNQTVAVDVRVIAATNRDLEAAINAGKFRRDLFYRLNVFPIAVPPLRERREDIPSLVQAFVRELSRSMGKTVNAIPPATMEALQHYDWPGNIRELRNVIERGMILSRGSVLQVELPTNSDPNAGVLATAEDSVEGTLAEVERRHILEVLDLVDWKVGGKDGAASRLGMNRTTLQGRMRKLKIHRPE